jgi:hypothetical protein
VEDSLASLVEDGDPPLLIGDYDAVRHRGKDGLHPAPVIGEIVNGCSQLPGEIVQAARQLADLIGRGNTHPLVQVPRRHCLRHLVHTGYRMGDPAREPVDDQARQYGCEEQCEDDAAAETQALDPHRGLKARQSQLDDADLLVAIFAEGMQRFLHPKPTSALATAGATVSQTLALLIENNDSYADILIHELANSGQVSSIADEPGIGFDQPPCRRCVLFQVKLGRGLALADDADPQRDTCGKKGEQEYTEINRGQSPSDA